MTRAVAVPEKPILFYGEMVRRILDPVQPKTQTRRLVKWVPLFEGLNLSFSGLSVGYYCTGVPESGHVLYGRNGSGVWEQRTKPVHCPYGQPGDRLYVKETFKIGWTFEHGHGLFYRADGPAPDGHPRGDGRPFYCMNGCLNRACKSLQYEDHRWMVEKYCGNFRKEPWRSSRFMPRWASRITLEIVDVSVERLNSIGEEDAIAEGLESVMDNGTGPGPGYKWDGAGYWDGFSRYDGARTWHAPTREGLCCCYAGRAERLTPARCAFRNLWDHINGKRPGCGWKDNPHVWRIAFRMIEP